MKDKMKIDSRHTYVAIMAGGIGSRFWPVSRTNYPKQFLDILGTGKTLIQQTVDRFLHVLPPENIFIVTAREYETIIHDQLPGFPRANVLCEPYRKNTAPCIAYISFKLAKKDPKATLIVAPSDHLILEEENFLKVCADALGFVSSLNALITLGIKPSYPNTGYGYIQHEDVAVLPSLYKVKTFTEKPNRELAETFIASGDFLWNSGIFVWKLKDIIEAFRKHLPEMYELFMAEQEQFNTGNEA